MARAWPALRSIGYIVLILIMLTAFLTGYYLGSGSGRREMLVSTYTTANTTATAVSVASTLTTPITVSETLVLLTPITITSTITTTSVHTRTTTVTIARTITETITTAPNTQPSITMVWYPSRVVNGKVYDITVEVVVSDDSAPIVYAELRFTPVRYDYFISRYGMRPEDYPKVFRNVNDSRIVPLTPLDGGFGRFREKFSYTIRDIVGGGEYELEVIVRDGAGRVNSVRVKTPYIREYENIAALNNVLVGAHYYPWYSLSRHWVEGYIGTPLMGRYDSRDQIVISKHIDWATGHGINFFIVSWWGPYSWEDVTVREYLLKNPLASDIKVVVFYETLGRLRANWGGEVRVNLSDQANLETLLSDFRFLAENYFKNPYYLKVGGKPVVILYLARVFEGDVSLALATLREQIRSMGVELFLVGDLVYWQDPLVEVSRIKLYDGVTSYSMYTNVKEILDNFEDNVARKYREWYNVTRSFNTVFIPSAIPGFDDRAVRKGNIPLPKSEDRFRIQLEIAHKYVDNRINMLIVTSFNEWHENTYIEPSSEEGYKYLEILAYVLRAVSR